MMIQWMMIFVVLLQYSFVNCTTNQCNYRVRKSDNSTSTCFANECYQFIDLLSIIVQPKTCKTSTLVLTFSSYQHFILFREQLGWTIGDLFPSQSNDQNRQLILFIDQLDFDDRPFDYDEIIRLGINIDFYILFIRNIQNKNYLQESIHYDINYPQWKIFKIKFECRQLSAFDKHPCRSKIISPTQFDPQRPIQSTTIIINQTDYLLSSSTEELKIKSNEEKRKLTHLILIIIIPIIIMMITMAFFIFIYIFITHKYCFKRDIMSTTQSLSNDPISKERNSCSSSSSSSISDNTIASQNESNIEHIECINIHSTDNLNNNYEKVTLDNISINGRQQHFVPISSSIHF